MPKLVVEKRRFPRVSLAASGLLLYKEGLYRTRLENISLAGALVSLHECDYPHIARGERCSLALYQSDAAGPLRLSTRMVHLGYDMACVRFVNLDQNTRLMLRSIIAHRIPERNPAPAHSSHCRG
jgi:c-di-GMP-binding flagellar brake protein YcgR